MDIPLENRKVIDFLSYIRPFPLKNCRPSSARRRSAINLMAFRWRADNGPLKVLFGSSHFPKKTLSKMSWAPSDKVSGSAPDWLHYDIDHAKCINDVIRPR